MTATPGTFVAVGRRGNIIRSINGGASWTGTTDSILGDFIFFKDVAGTGQTFIAIAPGSGIWRSTNAGASWTKVPDIDDTQLFQSIVCVSELVFVVFLRTITNNIGDTTGTNCFRTADGGVTWALVSIGITWDLAGAHAYVQDACIKSGVIYGITNSSTNSPDARSIDNGLTFSSIIRDPENEFDPFWVSAAGGLFLRTANEEIYHSATGLDGSWTLITLTLGEGAGEFGRFVKIGSLWFTFDHNGFGAMTTPDLENYTYTEGTGIDPIDLATDGLTVVYVGLNISVPKPGVYTTTASVTLTPATLPEGYDWSYEAVTFGPSGDTPPPASASATHLFVVG